MSKPLRARPPLFRALGTADPPAAITIHGEAFRRDNIFKHDSWAATAMYSGGGRRIVCKFNRMQSAGLVPMRWLGRALARREARALDRLSGLAGIPPLCGPIAANGSTLANAVAHDYIDGRPLAADDRPGRDFFPELLHLLRNVHARGIAYVDLHKRENILVGTDGRPWLIDFQVGFGLWSRHQRSSRLHQFILRMLQDLDVYHLAKHVRKHRPEQLRPLGLEAHQQPPAWIRAHRMAAVPLRGLRRNLLAGLRIRGRGGRVESEVFAEHAFRDPLRPAA